MLGSSLFLYITSDVGVASMNDEDFVDGISMDGNLYSDGSVLVTILGVECRKVAFASQS